jgi:hypothetical protein
MRGFGAVSSAARFCRCHDELRNLLHTNSHVRLTSIPAARRRRFPSRKPHCPHRDGFVMSSAMKRADVAVGASSDGTPATRRNTCPANRAQRRPASSGPPPGRHEALGACGQDGGIACHGRC